MTYPCGIIRDLLPLYIDEVCNEESKQAVEQHLSECEGCRNTHKAMTLGEEVMNREYNREELQMADSLKQVKNRINRKIKMIVLYAITAAALVVFGSYLLFNAAIKDVPLEEISVTANVYSLTELAEYPADVPDSESVTIRADEKDVSPTVEVKIPELGSVTLTEDLIEKCKYASVIHVSSDYFMRTIKQEIIDKTMYISAFKTSVLNNQTDIFNTQMISLEFREIDRIVYVDDNGMETVLWSE